jgi:hypothetical protein
LQQVELNTVTSPPPAPQFKRLKFYHQPFQKENKIIVVSTAVLRSQSLRSRNYKITAPDSYFKT